MECLSKWKQIQNWNLENKPQKKNKSAEKQKSDTDDRITRYISRNTHTHTGVSYQPVWECFFFSPLNWIFPKKKISEFKCRVPARIVLRTAPQKENRGNELRRAPPPRPRNVEIHLKWISCIVSIRTCPPHKLNFPNFNFNSIKFYWLITFKNLNLKS